jgi:hypothetical protein
MDAQLKKQLSLTINVRSAASRNNYGDTTFGSASSMSARVENKTEVYETSTGMEERQAIVVITESEIKITDRVFLPGDSADTANLGHVPRNVFKLYDEKGNVDFYRTVL